MRPQGDQRTCIAEGLRAGPGKTRELAARTGIAEQAARRTLDNMRKAGQVVVVDAERVPGVCRPVPVYDLAERHRTPAGWVPLQCWCLGFSIG